MNKPNKQELEKKYLKGEANYCPFCGSSNISGGQADFESTYATRPVECHDCGKRWIEGFKLVEVVFDSDDVRDIADNTEFDDVLNNKE